MGNTWQRVTRHVIYAHYQRAGSHWSYNCHSYNPLSISSHVSFFILAECTLMESHHGQVDVGGVQLQVDLPVDGGLAVLVEVLSHLRSHFSGTTKTSES